MATAPRKADVPTRDIRDMLNQASDRIGRALPKHLTPERMIQVASTLIYRTPKLQQCVPNTLYAAVVRASSLGLDLEPRMGEAYLIPRWNSRAKVRECHFQMGFQGVRKLATQSGLVRFLKSTLVHANDEFRFGHETGVGDHLIHNPRFGPGRGDVILVYSHARLATGEDHYDVMEIEEVNRIRDRVKKANVDENGQETRSPWDTDYGEMVKKTATIRHGKSLPRSTELAVAMAWDSEMHADGIEGDGPRVLSVRPGGRARGLAALQDRAASDEPSFAPGVDRPLRSEADPSDFPPIPDDEDDDTALDLPAGRMPGED